MINKPTLLAFTLALASPIIADAGNCSYDNVNIEFSNSFDYTSSCQALSRIYALDFFEENTEIKIKFVDEIIFINGGNQGPRAYGFYDVESEEIIMSSFETFTDPENEYKTPFNQSEFTSDFFVGLIAHEITHSILDSMYKGLSSTIQEYAAYYVQISTLDESSINSISATYSDSFDGIEQINAFILGADHFMFGFYSFKWQVEHPQTLNYFIENGFTPGDALIDSL